MGELVEIIRLVKEIPEKYLQETLEKVKEIKEKAEEEESKNAVSCPHCKSQHIVRNGHKSRKQAYICRGCGKSFVTTTKSAIEHSHSSETVWKQVISDTVNGVPIDKTAENLDLHHQTVFNMRHKILYCVEQSLIQNPAKLTGVCETDETYVLESMKGKKLPQNYHRKPRKHGAVASKPGISKEYVCVCTSVTGEYECAAHAHDFVQLADIRQRYGSGPVVDFHDVVEHACEHIREIGRRPKPETYRHFMCRIGEKGRIVGLLRRQSRRRKDERACCGQ